MKKGIQKIIFILMLAVTALVTACKDDDSTTGDTSFTVTPESLDFTATGGYKLINIATATTTTWEVTTSADWLSLSVTNGTGNKNINVQATENTVEEIRTATVTVSSASTTVEITVTQAAGETPVEENPVEETIDPDNSNMSTMTSVELTQDMGIGWNVGNSLEATGGETSWGNPMISKQLIDSVKEAGFNTVRIPVAWSKFSDTDNFIITEAWMNRVQQVVDYVIDNDMYAIVNLHWDGGWMQPTYADQDYVNNRLNIMWQQIAIHFRDYDYHLLFAGSNEVMVDGDYGTPTEEYYTVQNSFNETFINTVRATGGRNYYRYLVIQGFNTNIDYTVNFATIPTDVVSNRMLMEVHYYDPYNFSLNTSDTIWQWGAIATDPAATETWANESYVDTQFQKMKTHFIDQGMGVIMGEYGAQSRTTIPEHAAFRQYYMEYVTQSAFNHGLVPVYWDNGPTSNHNMGLFNRADGTPVYSELIQSITSLVP